MGCLDTTDLCIVTGAPMIPFSWHRMKHLFVTVGVTAFYFGRWDTYLGTLPWTVLQLRAEVAFLRQLCEIPALLH